MIGQPALMTAQHTTLAVGEGFFENVGAFCSDFIERTVLFVSAAFGSVSTDVVTLGLFGIFAVLVLLFISALVSVLGSPLTGGMKLVWVVGIFFAAFLGPVLWFVFGRRDAYRRAPAYAYAYRG